MGENICFNVAEYYERVSEYCFTLLSAQSWQNRDRRKPKVWTMPYFYRMSVRVLYTDTCDLGPR